MDRIICKRIAIAGLVALSLASRASADAPATQPAAGTPQAFVADLTNDKVAAMTLDQSMAILAYDPASEKEKADAKAVAENSIAASKLEIAARDKWGKDAESAVAHAIGDNTTEDVAQADWAVDGDHAVAQFKPDGLGPLALIRKNGQWKLDLAGEWKLTNQTIDDDLKGQQELSTLLDQLKKDLAQKDAYPNADAFVSHVKDEEAKLNSAN